MCGILGSIGLDFSKKPEVFENVLDLLFLRGPDERGVYIDNNVALGCQRLKIIDLDNGRQPIANEDNTLCIVFNGEIYNYRELRSELQSKGHIFKTGADTEVILHLYEQYGKDSLGHLDGMFSFAIWDKTKKTCFLARDRFGIKPLFYAHHKGSLLFSSAIKPIINLLGYKPNLSIKALNLYLWLDYVPAPFTIYEDIFALLPAHYLLLDRDNSITVKKYYSLLSDSGIKSKKEHSALELKQYLKESVSKHLISDVEVGIFLSGGIDSSILAFHAKQDLGALKSFSIGFDNASYDESRYAKIVSDFLKTEHYSKQFYPDFSLDYYKKIISNLDQPFADNSLLPSYFLSNFASQHVKVSLSGDGGDEVFLGYQTYIAHRIFSLYKLLPPKITTSLLRAILLVLPRSDRYFSLDFCIERFLRSQSKNDIVRHLKWMESFGLERKHLLGDHYQYVEDEYACFIEDNFITESDWISKIQQFDIYTYLSNDILYKTDFSSMQNSLEVRVPYLDRRIVEEGLSLPCAMKLKNFKTTKYILRKTYRTSLPYEIIKRKKSGFSIPVSDMFKKNLGTILSDIVESKNIPVFLDRSYIKSIFIEHLQHKSNNRKMLWNIFLFLIWYLENEN